jgi:hypothetical protein
VTYWPDFATTTMIARGEAVRAIGWLSAEHEYPRGKVRASALRDLRALCDIQRRSGGYLPERVDFMGVHGCEFCPGHYDNGELVVPWKDVFFIAPYMVVHYIEAHGYLPPSEFLKAVELCPSPGTPEYAEVRALALRLVQAGALRMSPTF